MLHRHTKKGVSQVAGIQLSARVHPYTSPFIGSGILNKTLIVVTRGMKVSAKLHFK